MPQLIFGPDSPIMKRSSVVIVLIIMASVLFGLIFEATKCIRYRAEVSAEGKITTFFYIYLSSTYIHVLKVKSTITGYVSVSYLGSETAKISSKKLRMWTTLLLVEALALNKFLLSKMKYNYKKKSLKARYTVTWWRTKLSKKILD